MSRSRNFIKTWFNLHWLSWFCLPWDLICHTYCRLYCFCLVGLDCSQDIKLWCSAWWRRFTNNIKIHTAHTIASWPNTKLWVIVHTSDLMMMIRQSIYIFSIITREMGQLKKQPSHIVQWITERICLILLTLSTKYIWQAFFINSMSSDRFAQYWWRSGIKYKQT